MTEPRSIQAMCEQIDGSYMPTAVLVEGNRIPAVLDRNIETFQMTLTQPLYLRLGQDLKGDQFWYDLEQR